MKCYLPHGCPKPDHCFNAGECYHAGTFQVYEARRQAAEREAIPDSDILAFGCANEADGHALCEEWCHLF